MNANAETLIQVKNLCKSYGDKLILKGISLDIHRGDVIAIIGPSGCGKSTFLRQLNLLELPTSGDILLDGKSILAKDVSKPSIRERVGMVFQQFNLFKNMTALKNIMFAPRWHGFPAVQPVQEHDGSQEHHVCAGEARPPFEG